MEFATKHEDLLPLLLVEESLNEGPECFERRRGIYDDCHRHALRITVRRDLESLPKYGLGLLGDPSNTKSFQINNRRYLHKLHLRDVAHGQETVL